MRAHQIMTRSVITVTPDATVLEAGEAIIIQTPTAGGYGKPGSGR